MKSKQTLKFKPYRVPGDEPETLIRSQILKGLFDRLGRPKKSINQVVEYPDKLFSFN